MFRHLLVAAVMTLGVAATANAGPKAAVFAVELDDVSIEGEVAGPSTDETRRLALVTDELRRLAAREAGYEVLDLGKLAPEIMQAVPLYKCNGCEAELARRAGAQVAITGIVRKVSGLILKMFVFVREAESGTITKAYQVDIKGNTDETWLRGMRWMAVNGLRGGRER
jgi:hypothetical protein